MTSEVTDFVVHAIASYLRIPVAQITPDRSFDELGLDSLGALELMLTCEERYGFGLSADGSTEIITVGDAIEDINRRVAASLDTADGVVP